MGDSPRTVTVSSSDPTRRSTSIVAVRVPDNWMPSRLTVLNPCRLTVTEYVPGGRETMRYCPVPSVTTDRTFSVSAGLAASTETPGNTAPDASLTVPEIVACCACSAAGTRRTKATRPRVLNTPCMLPPNMCPAVVTPRHTEPQSPDGRSRETLSLCERAFSGRNVYTLCISSCQDFDIN